MTFALAFHFHVYLPWVNTCLAYVLSSRGLLRDCKTSRNLREGSFEVCSSSELCPRSICVVLVQVAAEYYQAQGGGFKNSFLRILSKLFAICSSFAQSFISKWGNLSQQLLSTLGVRHQQVSRHGAAGAQHDFVL